MGGRSVSRYKKNLQGGQRGELIEKRLNELSIHSCIKNGIWRAAYTNEYLNAKNLIRQWMSEEGLLTIEDAVGNVFGRVKGESPDTILVGSHLDTVKNGGKYDGATGIVTAITAVGELVEEYGKPKYSVDVVAFIEEEGSRFGLAFFGSKAMMGKLNIEDLYEKDTVDMTIEQSMKKAGYLPERFKEAKRNDILSFIELHIEQGPILHKNDINIGIVQNIVGCITHSIVITGEQNHAGTTPMECRKDPVVVAAKFIDEITIYAKIISNTATLTVGDIKTVPGMINVIAREVKLSIDLRDGNKENLIQINNFIIKTIEDIKKVGYGVCIDTQIFEMPIFLDLKLIKTIKEVTGELNVSSIFMNSGAGHDAQIISDSIPACMIFIPSLNGISHSKDEFTSVNNLECGFHVLKGVIKKLAWNI